ncbi:MAG: hypothetical protein R3C68_10410 [Myxococcota bacterium]
MVKDQTGFGETGESYLVGADNLMRSDAPNLLKNEGLDSTILDTCPTKMASSAPAGENGIEVDLPKLSW